MDKYYLAQLDQSNGELLLAKLVDIQFARRPPTLGTLHLLEVDTRESVARQSLQLNTLNLTNDQSAKFTLAREINLSGALSEAINQKVGTALADFNTLNAQLLLEVSNSSTIVERLRSCCFVLTQTGDLCAISLIDSCVTLAIARSGSGKQSASGERFLSFSLSMERQENVLDHELASRSEPTLDVHVLSEQTYYHYKLSCIGGAKLDCDAHLLCKYSSQDGNQIGRSLRFAQFWVIRKRGADETIVLLKLSDNSRRFVKKGRCLESIDGEKLGAGQSELVALSANSEQETILLEYFNHKLVAYSLLISEELEQSRSHNDSTSRPEGEALVEYEECSDPDGLLPRAPSFELDECWSYDLTEIDGIRSKLMAEPESANATDGAGAKLNGCLCPLWAPSSTSKAAFRQLDESMWEASMGWPRLLLVASYSHLLLFSFEHEQALPFSLVYDRAFLLSTDGGSEPGERVHQHATAGKSIDLKLAPKLVLNFKLIGHSPADSLMNLLFLTQKVHLAQLKHFNQLGLFVGLTNEHHLLAFKLNSARALMHKDNLYQQSLLVALRKPSLLSEEIRRIETMNGKLVEQLATLEASHLDFQQTRGANEIESLVQVGLRADELIGGLYELRFSWPTVANFTRIVVISPVDLSFLPNRADRHRIRCTRVNNFHHLSHETSRSLEQGSAYFLDLESKYTNTSSKSSEFGHLDTAIKAWSILDLDGVKNIASLARNPFAEESITLPLFLPDGQQSEGQVRIYFATNNSSPLGRENRKSSLISEAHHGKTLRLPDENPKLPCKFIQRRVQLKQLQSYRPAEELEEGLKEAPLVLKLEIRGQFSDERMFSWLNECLDVELRKVPNETHQVASKVHKVELNFSSNFSHCFISVALTSQPDGQRQQSEGEVTICSDDFIALSLIEKHLFKRATDESIQLRRAAGRAPVVGIENLNHLIGRQQLNMELYLKLCQKREYSNDFCRHRDDTKRRKQIDLLLENLMSEALELQSLPVEAELKQSNLWLENSFRRDLERVSVSGVDSSQGEVEQLQCPLSAFLNMICGYIIEALVHYDHLHESTSTVESMLEMRSKLMSLIRESEFVNRSLKFAERVLIDWAEVKRRFN